jgi:uncharacterized protein (UPF0218 family)
MHRENDTDVIEARKALEKICENNPKYRFEIDGEYDMMVTNVKSYSGDAGVVFGYNTNGMNMILAVSDKVNQLSISSELKDKHDWYWYYKEYQRLHKLLENLLIETKNKTK